MRGSVTKSRRRARARRTLASLVLGAIAWLGASLGHAEENVTRDEFWPELDAYRRLDDHSRLFFLATVASNREEDFAEGMVGAHVDFYLKPLIRPWQRETADATSRRFLTFRLGYRYAWDLHDREQYQEHRGVVEATGRLPTLGRIVAINRNRLDLRAINGEWSWRYRNRTRLETDIPLGSRSATPYVMAEFYYDSRYDDWNRQRYIAGMEWPVGARAILDTYYCRQNDSRASITHVNGYGLALNMFF